MRRWSTRNGTRRREHTPRSCIRSSRWHRSSSGLARSSSAGSSPISAASSARAAADATDKSVGRFLISSKYVTALSGCASSLILLHAQDTTDESERDVGNRRDGDDGGAAGRPVADYARRADLQQLR